jgi:protein involved in polysaccharide export with SLBB domain
VRVCAVTLAIWAAGCTETDSFFDPSKTGYFETTPSSMPILTRIDVIEQASDGPEYVSPTPADLKASDLSYQLAPGDVVRIEIPNLMATGQTEQAERVVDQAGDIQVPVINKVRAAGLTAEELQTSIEARLKGILANPQAFVAITEARAYQFRILGSVDQPGLYGLSKPDLRLLDAIATARGASVNTVRVLITREVIANENRALYDPKRIAASEGGQGTPRTTAPSATPATSGPAPTKPAQPTVPADVDIDKLINELPGSSMPSSPSSPPGNSSNPSAPPEQAPPMNPPTAPPQSPAPGQDPGAPATQPAPEPAPAPGAATARRTQLGMLRADNRQAPPVDIDQLEPAKADDRSGVPGAPAGVQVRQDSNVGDQFIFDNATQSWVRKSSLTEGSKRPEIMNPQMPPVSTGAPTLGGSTEGANAGLRSEEAAKIRKGKRNLATQEKTVVIDIDYNALVRGQSNLNIVVRPGDLIYCDSGQVGVVYIDGEINRPGVYNLPTSGKLTLSRLVAAAGGVSELAIPGRCDLIRRLGSDKEACVRVSLSAIRNRGEPDIFLKPDDHVIVGTDFWALPLARFRRDFSMPNSIGFQLDRNFGNDVFGAPPSNIGNGN